MNTHTVAAGIALLSLVVIAALVPAQEPTVKRTELMWVPVEGFEGKEGVIYTGDFAPGATAPRHTHPGQEFIYVLEGSIAANERGDRLLFGGMLAHAPFFMASSLIQSAS